MHAWGIRNSSIVIWRAENQNITPKNETNPSQTWDKNWFCILSGYLNCRCLSMEVGVRPQTVCFLQWYFAFHTNYMYIVLSSGGFATHWSQICLNALLEGLPQACMHCEVDDRYLTRTGHYGFAVPECFIGRNWKWRNSYIPCSYVFVWFQSGSAHVNY